MQFSSKIFDEPLLEFGDKQTHADPRRGLADAGPLQTHVGELIKVAVVGSATTIEKTQEFIEAAKSGFESQSEDMQNLHPDFPGLQNRNPFRCNFAIAPEATSALSKSEIDNIVKEPDDGKAVAMAVEVILRNLQMLDDGGNRPDVAIIALPVDLIERVWAARSSEKGTTEKDDSSGSDAPNFRGLLKARAMHLTFPIQIIWEDIVNDKAKIPRKIKENRNRKTQDKADLAWNLMTTLYYKGSGRIPWRRSPNEGELTACYVGISFYRDVSGQQIWTSCAQMFDERGRGFILKGGKAQTETRGRHPYMTEQVAFDLTQKVLNAYRDHHKNYPARIIIIKTSQFREEEAEGIIRALEECKVGLRDLVWIQESYSVRVFRDGDYPVLRGTFVDIDGNGLLYTNGSIPYYSTYPGLYVPNPLLLCPHESSDSTISQIAEEVFSLTKINWNSTQINQKLPIPIRAARKVGEVLKYVADGQSVSPDYRRYI